MARRKKLRPRPQCVMQDPRLILHRLRTSTASHHVPGAGLLARCEAKKGKEEKTQAPPAMCYAGPSTGQASTTDIDCSHLRRRRAGRLACFEVEKEACWRGRPLHCTGRHPAAGSGRLRGGGAQEACWRGRRLHCTGHHPAAGSGRLRGAGWWRTGGLLAWTTTTLHGPPSGSRLRLAAGWWCTGGLLAWTTSTLHGPPSGGPCAPLAVAEALLYSGHCLAAGSCRLLAAAPPLVRCLRLPAWLPSISTIFPTGEPITSPARAAHTHICGLDKTPPP